MTVTLRKPLILFHLQLVHYVFAGIFLIRLTVLARLSVSPFLLPARSDMHFYDEWAQRILSGQFTDYLAFYGLPGYAYLLAFIYKLCGYGPFAPLFLQAFLDAGTATLIYKISVRVFAGIDRRKGQIAGVLAATGWALFLPAQTYAAILMPTAWLVFVFWFILWHIVGKENGPRKLEALLLGLLIGLTATAIATILFLIPLIVGAILLKPTIATHHQFRRARIITCALLFFGVIAGTAPCWLHNYLVARDRVFLSAHSGINFWIGNNPSAKGYPRFPPGLRAGQAAMLQDSIQAAETAAGHSLKRGEVADYWSSKARDYIEHHPVAWLRLLALKLRNFWSAFQYDDLSIITNLREQSVTFPGIYFGLVAAFALPAMILLWKTAPLSRWIAAAIALHLLALLPVFTTERYRLPIVPGLLVFAAFGLVTFSNSLAAGKFQPVISYGVLLIVFTLFVSWPQRDPSLWALDAYNSGWQALESGNLLLAENKLQLARAYVPTNPETNFALGNLKLAQGRNDLAISFYSATLRLDTNHRGALNNLGVMALDRGDFDVAETWFRRAEHVDPDNAKIHFLLAKTFLAKGDRELARDEIESAVRLQPDQTKFQELKQEIGNR